MLTIIIPTRNRSHFLQKSLLYYARSGCPYPIYLQDASDDEQFQQTERLIRNLNPSLNVIHQPCFKQIGTHESVFNVLKQVQTPYSVWCGDDDFLVPSAIQKCVDFLERHPDYNLASGVGLWPMAKIASNGVFDIKNDMGMGLFKTLQEDSPSQRLLNCFFGWTPNTFSVQRTENMRDSFGRAVALGLDVDGQCSRVCEYAINGANVIKGKSFKMEDVLYLVMVNHGTKVGNTAIIDSFDFFTHEHFSGNMLKVADWWAEEIVQREPISFSEAKETAKAALMSIMGKKMLSGWPQSAVKSLQLIPWKDLLVERFPLLKKIWNCMPIKTKYHRLSKITLRGLLDEKSTFHKDFLPIYGILTTSNHGV